MNQIVSVDKEMLLKTISITDQMIKDKAFYWADPETFIGNSIPLVNPMVRFEITPPSFVEAVISDCNKIIGKVKVGRHPRTFLLQANHIKV